MSIKTDAQIIRDETVSKENTALRVGGNLVDIAIDLETKSALIDTNTAKVGITPTQASNINTNSSKISYTDSAAVSANTAKVGITPQQASDITANNAKVSYTAQAAVALNTAKVSDVPHPLVEKAVPSNAVFTDTVYDDTAIQAEVDLNTAKNSYPAADSTKLAGIEAGATADQDLSGKQDVLVSGTNIKTINGESLLGATDIVVAAGSIEGTGVLSTGEAVGRVLQADGDDTCSWVTLAGGGDALTANPLSQFAPTTKAQLDGVISDGDVLYVGDVDTAAIALNTAKETNIAHPLVETAVPSGAVFTDTVYDDTAIQAEVDLNSAKDGITAQQTADIIDNNAKISYTDAAAVTANTAKRTYPLADETKLGLIEDNATADQTGAEIKTAYEAQADTNAFTDSEKTNLGNQSNTNTGDETTATIQTKRPLKTVNGNSIEGTGDVTISSGLDRVEEDLALSGAKIMDISLYETFNYDMDANTTFSISVGSLATITAGKSKVITIKLTGAFSPSFPAEWLSTFSTGTYDNTTTNLLVLEVVNTGTLTYYTLQISQTA